MSDYHVQEWMPKLQQTADELIKKIAEVAPELQVLFMGAAALGLPGKNDIDLDILCKHVDVKRYASVLTPILGAPQKLRDDMAIWSYKKDGIEIDCILSDPASPDSHIPQQKKTFDKLRTSPELQERYKKLKYAWDGLPYEQYESKKKAFLNEI